MKLIELVNGKHEMSKILDWNFNVLIYEKEGVISYLKGIDLLRDTTDAMKQLKTVALNDLEQDFYQCLLVPYFLQYLIHKERDIWKCCVIQEVILLAREELLECYGQTDEWLLFLYARYDFDSMINHAFHWAKPDSKTIHELHREFKDQYRQYISQKSEKEKLKMQDCSVVIRQKKARSYPRIYLLEKNKKTGIQEAKIEELISYRLKVEGTPEFKKNIAPIMFYANYLYPIRMERLSREEVEEIETRQFIEMV